MSVTKPPRGFQLLSPERRKEVSAMGGRALSSHQRGFARDPVKASAAAKKSALVRAEKRRRALEEAKRDV